MIAEYKVLIQKPHNQGIIIWKLSSKKNMLSV